MKLFEGKAKPSLGWAGTSMQKRSGRDRFGKIQVGEYRQCLIHTPWGQLQVPRKYMDKYLTITVEARK